MTPQSRCWTCGKIFQADPWNAGKYCCRPCWWKARRQQTGVRFWAKVLKTDTCWLWTGRKAGGYGRTGTQRTLGTASAHRVAWILTFGEIQDGLRVLHKCDNPPCVNPDHLFLGTDSDNMADKCKKQRQARGERQGLSPFVESDIIEIRRLRATGLSFPKIARMYGVPHQTIMRIVKRQVWKHVG